MIRTDDLEKVTPLLAVLDKRELKIIEARFGLDGQKPRTLEEVGQEFNVTRERIRQLQNIALKKLRRALQKKDNPTPHIKNGTIKTKKKVVKEVTAIVPVSDVQIPVIKLAPLVAEKQPIITKHAVMQLGKKEIQ